MTIDPCPALDRMRAAAPLVQNITNYVAMSTMANVMLCAGASPAMVHAPQESPDFMKIASALSINTGTLTATRAQAMHVAIEAAVTLKKPWVLDPVGCGGSAFRTQTARDLAALAPTIIRGNASEIMALAGEPSRSRGVDAGDEVDAASAAAAKLVEQYGAVICVTGPVDLITDGKRTARVANGHPLMPRVTGLGCALTGLCAAYAATTSDPFEATVAALAYYGACGEVAATKASGPGSFAVAFLDALASMTSADLHPLSKVTMS